MEDRLSKEISPTRCFIACLIALPLLLQNVPAQGGQPLTLFDFENCFDISKVARNDATVELLTEVQNHTLKVVFGTSARANIRLSPVATDLSGYACIAMDIKNLGTSSAISIIGQCDNDNAWPMNKSRAGGPGETMTLLITFYRDSLLLPVYMKNYLKGMRGLPGNYLNHWVLIDLSKINKVEPVAWRPAAGAIFSGRFDGENYRTGFINICDRPYPEMVDLSRKIGSRMYTYRLNGTGTCGEPSSRRSPKSRSLRAAIKRLDGSHLHIQTNHTAMITMLLYRRTT